MSFRNLIDREVQAFRREAEYKKQPTHSLSELRQRWEEYPSLVTRVQMFRNKCYRGVENVKRVPKEVRYFVHRGRHGWCPKDNWSMDYSLAVMMDARMGEFIKHFDEAQGGFNGAPISMFEDMQADDTWHKEHDAAFLRDLNLIQKGFHDYHVTNDNSWKIKDTTIRNKADEDALVGVKKSFELLAEHYPGLWW